MKTPIKSLVMAALVATAGSVMHAQLSPPLGDTNLLTSNIGLDLTTFDNLIKAGNNNISLLLDSTVYTPGKFDAGSGWTSGTPITPGVFGTTGGSVKVVYLGKTAGWHDDLGYVLNPPPSVYADHVPLVTGIGGTNLLTAGDYKILPYGAGVNPIDFFINAVPLAGDPNDGGVYYAFGTDGEADWSPAGMNIIWKEFLIGGLPTFVVGFEDMRGMQADYDYNDIVLAFQIDQNVAVPEPSTYGLIGAAALLGLIGYRRFKNKAPAATATPA